MGQLIFKQQHSDGNARTGTLTLKHGCIQTPALMPVATKATVKALTPDDLHEMDAQFLICNTYHLNYYGELRDYLKPWLETAIMRGEDKDENIEAFAIDIGATLTLSDVKYSPSISLSYAYASGDKDSDDQISNEFRQTDYEDNVDNINGLGTVDYYGELLGPELSNLKIITSGIGMRPLDNGSIEVVYHSYMQDHPDDKVRGDLIDPPARPNGMDKDIGWELDFVFAVTKLWNRVTISWIYSLFNPGESFAPYQENASLNRINLKIEI